MRAMVLDRPQTQLRPADVVEPKPAPGEVVIEIAACGVCRTDLHIVDGELANPELPLICGHQTVGRRVDTGERVGVPWLAWTCGECRFCTSGRENLCDRAVFTGYTKDGGFAQFTTADERYCFPIPDIYDDVHAAPLLCAGLIGYRCLRMCGDAERVGLYGFGAAAHIVCQVAVFEGRRVFVFTRGDGSYARELGAEWTGGSAESPPEPLDAAIVFAPAGGLVPIALRAVDKGGVVVLGGIHMTDIPSMPYELLWEERSLSSVANLTREDGLEFMDVASRMRIDVGAEALPLSEANQALDRLRDGRVRGALVLVP